MSEQPMETRKFYYRLTPRLAWCLESFHRPGPRMWGPTRTYNLWLYVGQATKIINLIMTNTRLTKPLVDKGWNLGHWKVRFSQEGKFIHRGGHSATIS